MLPSARSSFFLPSVFAIQSWHFFVVSGLPFHPNQQCRDCKEEPNLNLNIGSPQIDYNRRRRAQIRDEEVPIVGVAVAPYFQMVTNRHTRLLHHKNIRVPSFSLSKLKQQLRPVKDSLGWKVPRVYQVPCICDTN